MKRGQSKRSYDVHYASCKCSGTLLIFCSMKPIGIDIGLSKNSGGELSLEMAEKIHLKNTTSQTK